jgi:ribosomal protein S18 acetylase RimI-like enzyme
MNFDHRPFQEADAPAICSFPRSTDELFYMIPEASHSLTPERFAAAVRQSHDPTVGLFEGRIAGYIDFVEAHPKKFCAIGHLAVHKDFRRKGIGTYLARIMIQKAMDRYAVRFVRASCISHNKPAFALFHNLGFRPAVMGQRLGPDGDPVLVIHLHLPKRNCRGRGPERDAAGG